MAKRQKNRQHNGQKTEEQTAQWPKDRRTDNTMAKRQKNRQHNGQRQKNRQHNGQKKKYKRQTTIYKILHKDRVTLRHKLCRVQTIISKSSG